jgi:hypothetical protein
MTAKETGWIAPFFTPELGKLNLDLVQFGVGYPFENRG